MYIYCDNCTEIAHNCTFIRRKGVFLRIYRVFLRISFSFLSYILTYIFNKRIIYISTTSSSTHAHARVRKRNFERFFLNRERKEKLRQKKRESPQRENSLQACIIFVASRKRSKPFAFLSLIHHCLVFVEIDDFEHHD